MKKYLFIAAAILLASTFVAKAATVLQGGQGGTGYGSTTISNAGKCLSVVSTNPLTYAFTTCSASSSSATTTINGLNGPHFTFATSTDPNIGVVISGSGSTLTFTPVWIGTLANNRIASSSYWTSKLDPAGDGSSLSGIVVSVASSTDIAVSGRTGTNLTFSFLNPQGFVTATSTAFITPSGLYAPGFITATSTAFVTPSGLYTPGFITATSTTFVPYTGAINDVDIGAHQFDSQTLNVDQYANYNGFLNSGFYDYQRFGSWAAYGSESATGGVILGIGGYRNSQWSGIDLFTSGAKRLSIDSAGRVGIGTTTPSNSLSVVGNIQIASSTAGLVFGDGSVQTTAAAGSDPYAPGFITATSTAFIATTTGDWLGTWQGNSPSFFLTNSVSSTWAKVASNGSDFTSTSTFRNNVLGTGTGAQMYFGDGQFKTASTTNITEGTNLYWTQARFNAALNATTSDALPEGSTNRYFTDARLYAPGFVTATSTAFVTPSGLYTPGFATATSTAFLWRSNNLDDLAASSTARTNLLGSAFSFDAVNGRFGVGTSTPSSNLHIWNAATSTTVNVETDGTTSSDTASINLNAGPYLTALYTSQAGGGSSGFYTSAPGGFTIYNSVNTSVLRATQTGLVGIGSSTPSETLSVGGNIKISSSTGGLIFNDGTKLSTKPMMPIQWVIENPTASENDSHFIFRVASTISSCAAVNKTHGDTVTFGLGYSSSRGTATSSLTQVMSSTQTVTATTTPATITLNGTLTPGANNPLIFYTTAASSTQFTLTCFYSEN